MHELIHLYACSNSPSLNEDSTTVNQRFEEGSLLLRHSPVKQANNDTSMPFLIAECRVPSKSQIYYCRVLSQNSHESIIPDPIKKPVNLFIRSICLLFYCFAYSKESKSHCDDAPSANRAMKTPVKVPVVSLLRYFVSNCVRVMNFLPS